MDRRGFLTLVGSATTTSLLTSVPVLGAPRRKPTVVVVTDVTPELDLPRFVAMVGTMLAQGLPVTCIVHTQSPSGKRLTPDSELARTLRRFLRAAPGVLEIVAYAPGMSNGTEFQQARTAFRARQGLIEALFPESSADFSGPLIQSIATEFTEQPALPVGVRSAGVRNVLVLPKASSLVASEYWDAGVLRLTGGARVDLLAALEHLGGLSPDQFQNILLLSARGNSDKSIDVVKAASKVFSNVALQYEAEQWISTLRLADIQLRDGYFRFERNIGLHLFEPRQDQPELVDGFKRFSESLTRERISFSTGPDISDGAKNKGYWIETEAEKPVTDGPEIQVDLDCALAPPPVSKDSSSRPGAGVRLALDYRLGGIQGIDNCGNLRIPTLAVSNLNQRSTRPLAGTSGVNDLILTIKADQTRTLAQQNILRTEIAKLTGDWITKIVPVPKLVNQLVPRAPLISLYRHTEAYIPRTQANPKPLTDKDRDLLFEDAVTAWSYFYRFTNKTTGLCPSTVFYSGGQKNALNSATMWDVASQINALIAAVDIGLIKEREFRRSIRKILANITGQVSGDRRLPNEWIRTNRNNRGNKNFDGCDAGRLLASLHNLRNHRYSEERVEKLFDDWTLDFTIRDRRIHSVIDNELLTTYDSHCAHYSALAFRKWGFDVESPYEVFQGAPTSDGKMALLEAAAKFGAIGAEPLLLESLDFGLSPQSAYLADVLLGAQMREFDITGDLICVSESPIDREPWFTYQGLQLNAPDRTWVIGTVKEDEKYKTEKFRRENRVTATKAAFLWAAERPQSFSRSLLEYVRKHGRTPIGFASAIYSKSDTPTRNYTDINTNGIILQAVAKMLSENSNSG